jgi:tetratricopeptide (TPR) repeat protein
MRKISIGVLIVLLLTILTLLTIYFSKMKERRAEEILSIGLTKGQNEYFQEQLRETGKQFGYIQKGYSYLRSGNFDSAVEQFEIALENAYSDPTRGEAILGLSKVYEKKRDYEKALEYAILIRDKHTGGWANPPHIERAKYLEYASKGEYELAIEHAKKAIEANNRITQIKINPSQDYIDRLNDLIAAKDYIERLK